MGLAKRYHLRKKCSDTRLDVRKTWSLINYSTSPKPQSRKNEHFVSHFPGDEQEISIRCFSRVTGVAQAIPGICTLQNIVSNSPYLPPLTEGELGQYYLHWRLTSGLRTMAFVLMWCAEALTTINLFYFLFLNHTIVSGVILLQLKKAIVFPLFKSGARNKIENYRPISIHTCIGQILEKRMLNVRTGFLWTNDVFSISQYFFIVDRGTETLLEDLSYLLNSTFERNTTACGLFLDVSKAFDSVCHAVLLSKLRFRWNFQALL